jgi:hypothetical protein
MKGVTIYGDTTDTPPIGLLLARRATGVSAGQGTFINVNIFGKFTGHGVYNYASEVNSWYDCHFYANAPNLLTISQDNSTYSITLPNSSLTNEQQSNNDHHFFRCYFDNTATSGTATAVVELLTVRDISFKGCFFNDTAGDISLVKITKEDQVCESVSFKDCLFHGTYQTGIYFNGAAQNITVKDNRWGTSWTTANIGAAANTPLTDVHLEAVDIDFSAANVDVLDSSFIKITEGSSGFLSISRFIDGIVERPHDASVTFSGNASSQVTCQEIITGSSPRIINHGANSATYDSTAYKDYSDTAVLLFATADTQTIWSKTLNDEESIAVTAWISVKNEVTAERGMYAVRAYAYRDGGGAATLQGAVQDIHTAVEVTGGQNATIDVDTNDVRVRVTNSTANNHRWIARVEYQILTS